LVVALSGAGIRPGESDNREEFWGIENRDRLKGLILYLRQLAHGRQESAVEGQYHELDQTEQTSRSKLKTTFRYTWITAERLNEEGPCHSTLDNILIFLTADVKD